MEKLKILIAENDEDEVQFICESFEASGLFEVIGVAETGVEVLRLLTENKIPDLILSDLNMPGKSGYDVLCDVRTNPAFASIPVYISSTSSTPATIRKCLELGARDYLIKPDSFYEYDNFARNLYKRIITSETLASV